MDEIDKKLVEEIDLEKIDSVALRRLIEEIRNDKDGKSMSNVIGYNRVYNRHNR